MGSRCYALACREFVSLCSHWFHSTFSTHVFLTICSSEIVPTPRFSKLVTALPNLPWALAPAKRMKWKMNFSRSKNQKIGSNHVHLPTDANASGPYSERPPRHSRSSRQLIKTCIISSAVVWDAARFPQLLANRDYLVNTRSLAAGCHSVGSQFLELLFLY